MTTLTAEEIRIITDTDEALCDVGNEMERARAKFPSNEHLLAALMEEVGELAKSILDHDILNVRNEAIQVACVALRIATEGDSDFPHTTYL